MNVDLSMKEIELVLERFGHDDREPDEEFLVHKLRRHSEKREEFMRQYQQDFKTETPLPPLPQET
jgi:hypothetical protein